MSYQCAHFLLLKSQYDLAALHQDGPLDEIGVGGHQLQRFGARRRIFLHLALAIELVARVQKRAVVALADEAIQLLDGQSFIEVDFLEIGSLCAKPTLRVAAGGSSGFGVKGQCRHGDDPIVAQGRRRAPFRNSRFSQKSPGLD